jgi:hypothetical protein
MPGVAIGAGAFTGIGPSIAAAAIAGVGGKIALLIAAELTQCCGA